MSNANTNATFDVTHGETLGTMATDEAVGSDPAATLVTSDATDGDYIVTGNPAQRPGVTHVPTAVNPSTDVLVHILTPTTLGTSLGV